MKRVSPVRAVLLEKGSEVLGDDAPRLFQQGWYGRLISSTLLSLDSYETLHLLERHKLEVFLDDASSALSPKTVARHFARHVPNFWRNYLVYKDLRNRGYVIRSGGMNEPFYFRQYPRGAIPDQTPYNTLILPLQEGSGFPLTDLDQIIQLSVATRKQLVFVLVDSLGEVSYVSVSEAKLKDISQGKPFASWEGVS